MKAAAASILAALALSACVTADETWPTETEIAAFGDSGNAIVVLAGSDNFNCGRINIGFEDLKTHAKFNRQVFTSEPGAIFAKPGLYTLNFADCQSAMGHLQGVEYWFGDVEVKPNEVVYLGTFNLTAISVASQANALQNIFSLGISALTGNPSTYPVYAMLDDTENVRAHVRKRFPQLADRMVTRVPEAILSREDFAEAFRQAYARKPDGSMPTEEEATAKLDGEIDKAIVSSLAKYLAAHPEARRFNPNQPTPRLSSP